MTSVSSVDLSDIFEVLEQPHQYEGYVTGLCPFHPDTRPSFFVYPDWYRCQSCGANGPTDKLLYKLGKIARPPSVRAQSQGGPDNPFSRWAAQRPLKATLRAAWATINDNEGMGRYIVRDRGVFEPYRRKLGVGYMDDWYTIPITNRYGQIISAVARRGRDNPSTSKYVLPNGTDPNLLYVPNWKIVRAQPYLIVCFGVLDAIILAILGLPAASTLTGLRLNKAALAAFRKPILILPDQREEKAGLAAVMQLGWRGELVRVNWPENCKDINDIWVRDPERCRALVQEIHYGVNRKLGDQCRAGADQTVGSTSGDFRPLGPTLQ